MFSDENLENQHQKDLSMKSHWYSNFIDKFYFIFHNYNLVNDIKQYLGENSAAI